MKTASLADELQQDRNVTVPDGPSSRDYSADDLWGDYDVSDYDYDEGDYFDEEDESRFYGKGSEENEDDESEEDFTKDLPPEIYCDLINTLNEKCLESSILEIWKFSAKRIAALTRAKILEDINLYRERQVHKMFLVVDRLKSV